MGGLQVALAVDEALPDQNGVPSKTLEGRLTTQTEGG
jgi:hypothetical protein